MKNKVGKTIIIVVVIAVISILYAFVDRDVSLYDNDTYTRSSLTTPMSVNEESEYNYEFHCDYDNLDGFRMILSYVGNQSGTIEYTVYDSDGNQVCDTETKKLSSFKNGKYTTLKVDIIKDSADKDYTLNIRCSNTPENAALVMCEPDDTPQPGILYLYKIWDLETMIVVALCLAFLVFFGKVLIKIFRK